MMIHQQQLLFPNMKFHLVNIFLYGRAEVSFPFFAGMLYDMKTFRRWLQRVTGKMIGGLYE